MVDGKLEIKILLVDDITEAREGIKKLLAFEPEFRVIGDAPNGREGVRLSKELKPDIVIMDINMPDMDGLEAAALITKAQPTIGVIMMSVQDDQDYMQRAMLAGARFFLPKPPSMDRLYSTIRSVYEQYGPIREQFRRIEEQGTLVDIEQIERERERGSGARKGYVIAVYSPQGGAGTTTIATSLASGLMREGIKTLLMDGDLQFGDVGAFLDLRSQQNVTELVENIDDIDEDYLKSIITDHDSGMKVLLGPNRPALGAEIRDVQPDAIAQIIDNIRGFYDFLVVDTSSQIDAVTGSILATADKIVLITLPTLPSIKNTRLVLDMFDQNEFAPEKTALVLNKVIEDPRRARGLPSPQKIQDYLKRPVKGLIPMVDEVFILRAITRGIPVIASDKDRSKSPIKQLVSLSDSIYRQMMGEAEVVEEDRAEEGGGIMGLFGRRR
ncbi:MAG: response regulator [Aggregatilineales bacterium]